MKTLTEYLHEYEERKKAIGHFNVATIEMLWGVINAAKEFSQTVGELVPVVIGMTENERDVFGVSEAVAIIQTLRSEGYPVFLNGDHTYITDRANEAIAAHFDMVIIDKADKSFEENVLETKKVVDFKNTKNSHALVEAELGFIGAGSSIKDSMPEGVSEATMTKPEDAKAFVEQTGIDVLAPSVGNVHGLIKTGKPRLHPERVRQIKAAVGIPLVLHGGSGSTDDDFRAVIQAGISLIHVSTELRVAYRNALEHSLATNTELAPYKYMKEPMEAVKKVALERIALFYHG